MTRTLYIASGNAHKIQELKLMLSPHAFEVFGSENLISYQEPKETGKTFQENSLVKASALFDFLKKQKINFDFVLSDDSGLVCEDLRGEPGVHSSRYAGEVATALDNNKKLMSRLKNLAHPSRQAAYHCVLTLINSNREKFFFDGICSGLITFVAKGKNGFGYDPHFYLKEFDKTMAELSPQIKNQISHRAKALQKLILFLDRDLASGIN